MLQINGKMMSKILKKMLLMYLQGTKLTVEKAETIINNTINIKNKFKNWEAIIIILNVVLRQEKELTKFLLKVSNQN